MRFLIRFFSGNPSKTREEKLAYSLKKSTQLFEVGQKTQWQAIPEEYQTLWLITGNAIINYGSSEQKKDHFKRLSTAVMQSQNQPAHDFLVSALQEYEAKLPIKFFSLDTTTNTTAPAA